MQGFSLGVERVDITPNHSLELCGYGNFLGRISTGIHDNLYATAMVFDDGNEKTAVISLDLIGLEEDNIYKIRERIRSYTGIPPENTMVACTHTHHGPATAMLRACGEKDPEYLEMLPELIADSAILASKTKSRVEDLMVSRGHIDGVSYNRAGHEYLDNELFLLVGGQPDKLCCMINFPCHPVVLERDNTKITKDFPGAVIDYLSGRGFDNIVYTNGACGDIDPIINQSRKAPEAPRPYRSDFADLEFYGKSIGEKAMELIGNASPIVPDITVSSRRIQLPLDKKRRKPETHILYPVWETLDSRFYKSWRRELDGFISSGKPFPDYLEAEIQAIRIGDQTIIGIPGEILTKIGLRIKENHPNSVVIGYANGMIGYIPTKEDVLFKGYGYVHGYKMYGLFPFSPDTEDALIDGVDSVLGEFR